MVGASRYKRLLTLFTLLKLFYTAEVLACMPIYIAKEGSGIWNGLRRCCAKSQMEWMDGVDWFRWIPLRLLRLLKHLWC